MANIMTQRYVRFSAHIYLSNVRASYNHIGHPLNSTATFVHTRCTICETAFCGTWNTLHNSTAMTKCEHLTCIKYRRTGQHQRPSATRPQTDPTPVTQWPYSSAAKTSESKESWHLTIKATCIKLSLRMLWWKRFHEKLCLEGERNTYVTGPIHSKLNCAV